MEQFQQTTWVRPLQAVWGGAEGQDFQLGWDTTTPRTNLQPLNLFPSPLHGETPHSHSPFHFCN